MLIPTRKFLIALILLLGLAAAPALAQEDIAQVGVDAVIVEPLAQTAPVIGRLVTTQAGTVAARINGAVDSVRVEVGDRVAKGDALYRIHAHFSSDFKFATDHAAAGDGYLIE